jgi:hypothetical protein
MKQTTLFFLGAALAGASLFTAAGCGGDGGNTGGSGGTGGGGTGGSTTTSSSTSTTSSSSSSGTPSLTCDAYCAEVMANCTDANAQFPDMATCMGTCAAYPAGALTDMSGNTLGCRLYHGGAPSQGMPAMHCPHAGLTGGDKDPTDTSSGVCGEACDAFCTVALKACAGQTGAYADMAECMNECKTFTADTADFNTSDTGTNDYGCRVYHLTVASKDAASAATHCAHIRANSPVCTQ